MITLRRFVNKIVGFMVKVFCQNQQHVNVLPIYAPRFGQHNRWKSLCNSPNKLRKNDTFRHHKLWQRSRTKQRPKKAVLNHLHKIIYKKKLDIWVRHDLILKNPIDGISLCESLPKRKEIEPSSKRLITDEKKWIIYDNNFRKKKLWSTLL